MKRSKGQKNSVRLSVTLDGGEYAELSELAASLDLSEAWRIRRVVSEFITRHCSSIENDLPLRQPGELLEEQGEKEKRRKTSDHSD